MRSTLSLSLSDSEFESGAGWMLLWLSCTIEVKILLPICAFTTLTFSSFFPLNAILWWWIKSSSLPTLRDDNRFLWWRSYQSISLYSCCFLFARLLSLFVRRLSSFECQIDAQDNLQKCKLFWNNVFFRQLFDCLFIPCSGLTLLKHLFYWSSRLIIIRFAAARKCFRTWWVVKVEKFAVIGIKSWSWRRWRRTYEVSKFILPFSNFSHQTQNILHWLFAFSCSSSHTFNVEIYLYSNILRSQEKCFEVSTPWNLPCSSEGETLFAFVFWLAL